MKNLIRLTELTTAEMYEIFHIADEVSKGGYLDFLKGKTVVMFFPDSSIRTRVTFEKGIYLLGGQSILFPPASLDKKEDIRDVAGYLNNWADAVIVRHKDISLMEGLGLCAAFPVINAMSDSNHPCEMLSDLYALWKLRPDFEKLHFLFVGASSNIGLAWKEASKLVGFPLLQCCPKGYEIEGAAVEYDIQNAMRNQDIILTDSLPGHILPDFTSYRITSSLMALAKEDALLNPCPPFYRGEEVSAEVIASPYFAGYTFKKSLLHVQQAIMIYCMTHELDS